MFSIFAAAALGLAAKPSIVKDWEKQNPSEIWQYLSKPIYTAPVGLIFVALVIFKINWIVATWRGRTWALSFHLATNGLGAALGLLTGSHSPSLILYLAVTIYCILRLSGKIGPAVQTPAAAPRRRKSTATRKKSSGSKNR